MNIFAVSKVRGRQEINGFPFYSSVLRSKMIDKNAVAQIAEEFLQNSTNYLIDVIVLPGNVIQVEIDNNDRVSIDECVELSRFIESKLDREVEDFELTVGSAGLTSPFKVPLQYKKYEGKEVEVLTKKGEKLKGTLSSSDDNGFSITILKKVKLEGAKRKSEVEETLRFDYNDVKYTKYLIQFK